MKKSVLPLVVCFALGIQAFAQEAGEVLKNLASNAHDARRHSFDIVWRTAKEKHFDPNFGGVDWDAARRKYEPRLSKVKKDGVLYSLLNEMLGELHQSHFGDAQLEAAIAELQKSPRRVQ